MKILPLLGFAASTALIGTVLATDQTDPFIWLEEAHSERAMNWVKAENAKTDGVLERDPRFEALFHDAKVIVEAKDRIPEPCIIAGQVFNFWQDADHAHGIWRQTSQTDFQSAAPALAHRLDLDALSKSEKANWFWKGAIATSPRNSAAS